MPKFEIGFWNTKTIAVYRSGVINTASLPDQIRILIRHNALKRKGDKKPTYIGTIVDAEVESTNQKQFEDISCLKSLIQEANNETSIIRDPVNSRQCADKYWEKIIREVERICDEKINIQCWGASKNFAEEENSQK